MEVVLKLRPEVTQLLGIVCKRCRVWNPRPTLRYKQTSSPEDDGKTPAKKKPRLVYEYRPQKGALNLYEPSPKAGYTKPV